MGTGKIMPGFGCLANRLHREAYLRGDYYLEPCIMCDQRDTCKKTSVDFNQNLNDGANYP
jgi:hypothetical protein